MFYSQRRPEELGVFHWVVDAKDRERVTDWEDWWSYVVMPIIQSKSLRKPMGYFAEGDYSYFERFEATLENHPKPHANDPSSKEATDLRKVITESFRFSSDPEPGLELIDILANATRRAMAGNLKRDGWKNIPRLMIHRRGHYIQMIALTQIEPNVHRYPYMPVLRHFTHGGKSMLAPRFL